MKKMILTVILIFVVVVMACGCGATEDRSETITNDGRSIYSVDISQRETLVYDTNTRIVYISQYTYNGNSVYTLYLSENGFPYRYVDGRLVEVGQ